MCTLSFVPTKSGYLAAMNRDELLTRRQAQAPKLVRAGELWAAYPSEGGVGTWIATNERGITLGLLNWNLPHAVRQQSSRGSVIPQLIGHPDLADVDWAIRTLNLDGILPFRLVGILWPQEQVCEWRWTGTSLQRLAFPWQPRHWFSSGLSDETAEASRTELCRTAWNSSEAGTLPWLRELHRSHGSAPGPFSMCVHRSDAASVSYTEIAYESSELTFRYVDGPPCANGCATVLNLPLVSDRGLVVA